MGFKVDIKELTDYKNDIKRTSSAVKGQIENAIQSMRAIPSSQAMEGQVGMAVSETISSNHIPTLIGLKSSYDQLASEVEKTLNDFKSSTGESSGSAVITEDVLTRIPGKLDNLLESYNERTNSIKGIYTEISDLVSLTLPKSNLAETINDTKKHVKKIQTDVSTFENGKTSDSIDALLSQIESQIGRITSTKSLGYGSPNFLFFSMKNEFVSTMDQAEKAMIQQERLEAEEIRKQKAEDWNRLGPYDYYLKYPEENGKGNPNFNANMDLINSASGIVATSGNIITGNVILKEGVASGKKIKAGTWYGKKVKSTKSGYKTWKQVNGDVNRFKSVKGAKNLDEIANGTGKFSQGIKGFGYLGVASVALESTTTYFERKEKYGNTSATIDAAAHGASAAGAIYAGAAIGSLIPIPVLGTVIGAATGFVIGNVLNSVWDELAHSKDNDFFSWKTLFG